MSYDLDLFWKIGIGKEKVCGSYVAATYENACDGIFGLHAGQIVLRVAAFDPNEKVFQPVDSVILKTRDNVIDIAPSADRRICDPPKIKWSGNLFDDAGRRPDQIIGDMNFADAPIWKPLFRADFGVCGDDAGLFGPKNNKRVFALAPIELSDNATRSRHTRTELILAVER
jgi:hypothetical protein